MTIALPAEARDGRIVKVTQDTEKVKVDARSPAAKARRSRVRRALYAVLTAVAIVPIVVYLADALAVRLRMPLDEVTVYDATTLKNGKVEIFWDTPQREVCVRALFPHLGHAPCWYVRRRTVRLAAAAGRVMGTLPALPTGALPLARADSVRTAAA